MTSLEAFHRRLLNFERRNLQAEATPAHIAAALWRAEKTGKFPDEPALAGMVQDFLKALAAIERLQLGAYKEEGTQDADRGAS